MNLIYHYIGMIIFWLVLVIITFLCFYFICVFIYKVYKRTYLHYAIQTLIAWYNWDYKKNREHDDATYYDLMAFRRNKTINRMPKVFRNYWFKIIDYRIEELRNDIKSHGEVPSF